MDRLQNESFAVSVPALAEQLLSLRLSVVRMACSDRRG